MDEAQKPSNSEYRTPSSELFRFYIPNCLHKIQSFIETQYYYNKIMMTHTQLDQRRRDIHTSGAHNSKTVSPQRRLHEVHKIIYITRDSVVVKALCYKPEGRGFDIR
jgi:hypothetical protein